MNRQWSCLAAMFVYCLLLSGCGHESADSIDSYVAEVSNIRQERLSRLLAPDGLLSNVASGRLDDGRHGVGSARGNRIRLPDGPGQAGWVEIVGDRTDFIQPDGARLALEVAEPGGQQGTRVPLGAGFFFLVRNGGNLGWRYQLPGAEKRHPFKGFAYFPLDPQWRITAAWVPYYQPRPRAVMTSNGGVLDLLSPGEARFSVDGEQFVLRPILLEPEDHRWMFLFSDKTSGKESFAGGRYLLVDPTDSDTLVMDFNLSENPTCALTPHVVCPVPPLDSHLDVSVRAGERVWHPLDQPPG